MWGEKKPPSLLPSPKLLENFISLIWSLNSSAIICLLSLRVIQLLFLLIKLLLKNIFLLLVFGDSGIMGTLHSFLLIFILLCLEFKSYTVKRRDFYWEAKVKITQMQSWTHILKCSFYIFILYWSYSWYNTHLCWITFQIYVQKRTHSLNWTSWEQGLFLFIHSFIQQKQLPSA